MNSSTDFQVRGRCRAQVACLQPAACIVAACAAATVLLSANALADGVQKLEKIEVVGHYDTGVGTTDAASAGYITPLLIDDRPLLRPGEVMEYIPGMIVTQHSGAGKANQYFLRGFNLDHGTDFETTIAGMPVNMRSHAHGQGYTDLNFLIPELVARIDYFKGPYYAQQGDFATAGSANIHLAEKLAENLGEAAMGSEKYGRALMAGSPAFGAGRLVYGLEVFHDNGPWDTPENYRKFNGVLRYTQTIADGKWGITAMAYSGQWTASDQVASRAVNQGLVDRFGTLDGSDGGKSSRYSLSADYQHAHWGGQLQSTLYGIRYELDLFSNFSYYLVDPVHGDQFNQHDQRMIYGWNGSWTRAGRVLGLETHNTLGWNIRYDDVDPLGLYRTEQRQRLATVRQDRVKEASAGVYLENEIHWNDWLRSVAGLRGDRYAFSVADSAIAANSGSSSAGQGSPKLSLVFGPWAKTEYFLNFGEGFHSNDGRGTTTHIDPNSGDRVGTVTALVRAKGAEVGVRTESVAGLQSSLALWYLHLDSELVLDADAGTNVPGRPSQRTGIEWSNHYRPAKWLLLDLDVAYTRARFTDDNPVGNRIPEALQAAVSAGVTLHDLGPWTASLFGRYFGPRPLIENASVKSQSTILFNSQVTYKAGRNLRLRFDVFNIFDRRDNDVAYYYTSRLPGEPAAGVNDTHFHPTESRAFRVSALYSF